MRYVESRKDCDRSKQNVNMLYHTTQSLSKSYLKIIKKNNFIELKIDEQLLSHEKPVLGAYFYITHSHAHFLESIKKKLLFLR